MKLKNLNKIILILFLYLSNYSFADGIDKVSIYLNGNYLTNTSEFKNGNYLFLDSLEIGDTLMFIATTDWGGLDSATLDIKNKYGDSLLRVSKFPFRAFTGAVFLFIINKEHLKKRELNFTLNFDSWTKVKPWKFVSINNSSASIYGTVHSSASSKLITKKAYIINENTNHIVKIKDGKFKLNYLRPNTFYKLKIKAFGYEDTIINVTTNKTILSIIIDLLGCEYSKKQAELDWASGNAKLLLKPGGIRGNPINRSQENKFEIKYNIEYVGFGCVFPEYHCLEDYNKRIFELMDEKHGKSWRKEARFDVMNLNLKK